MVVKFFYALVAVFGVAMVFLVAQNPYLNDDIIDDFSVSSVQISGVKSYDITKNGVLGVYQARQINRYKDADEATQFQAQYYGGVGLVHFLQSDKALKRGDRLEFIGHVRYRNSNRLSIVSTRALYDMKTKEGIVPENFTMWQDLNRASGSWLKYDVKSKQLWARGVQAWLEQ